MRPEYREMMPTQEQASALALEAEFLRDAHSDRSHWGAETRTRCAAAAVDDAEEKRLAQEYGSRFWVEGDWPLPFSRGWRAP